MYILSLCEFAKNLDIFIQLDFIEKNCEKNFKQILSNNKKVCLRQNFWSSLKKRRWRTYTMCQLLVCPMKA